MKPPTHKRRRLILRIKPGGFLRIPLLFLRNSGWQSDDVLLYDTADGYLRLFKPPTETTWRIERLRKRLKQDSTDDSSRFSARNYAEFRRMSMSRPDTRTMHASKSQLRNLTIYSSP